MLKINLLKNNIPNKIDIPKKPKFYFVKFLIIFGLIILALGLAIFAGFYFAKKQVVTQTKKLEKPLQISMTPKKEKKVAKSNNNTFNITVELQNATLNQTQPNLESQEPVVKQKLITTASQQKKEVSKIPEKTPNEFASKPAQKAENTKKSCIVSCSANQLNELKSVLEQKHIEYSIKQNANLQYYYIVYVGGLEKHKFSNFENALKSKGYNVVGTKIVNDKYYANLGKMSLSDKDRFLAAWKNLGFDMLVDKQKEMSIKDYEVNFVCTRDVFEELKQKGFRVSAGRGAAW